jgi:hypothetical protein
MRVAALFAAIAAGCGSSGWYHTGPDAAGEVQEILRSGPGGEASLIAGDTSFWIPGNALVAERRALFDSLAAARPQFWRPPSPEESERFDPDLDAQLQDARPLPPEWKGLDEIDEDAVVWRFRTGQTLEVRFPGGSLRVERRVAPFGNAPPGYLVLWSPGGFGRRWNNYEQLAIGASKAVELAWGRLVHAADGADSIYTTSTLLGPRNTSAVELARQGRSGASWWSD